MTHTIDCDMDEDCTCAETALLEVQLLNEQRVLAQHREDLREHLRTAHWHQTEIDLCVQRIKKLEGYQITGPSSS